ncbi:MAG: hypothetical protein ACP5G0_03120 [Desulfomonilia bacterium]
MRSHRKVVCGFVWLILLFCFHPNAFGHSDVQVSGIGPIEGENLPKAEQIALQDAFSKAILQVALTYVPAKFAYDLVEKIPEYTSTRGMQDVLQYQILSRTRSYDVLQLNVEVRLNDEYLKNWLLNRALTTPFEKRPKIVLMITTYGPGDTEMFEWWSAKGEKVYSLFERHLAEELGVRGEYILDASRVPKNVLLSTQKPLAVAASLGADLLLTGSITYTPVQDTLYEASLDLKLLDVQTEQVRASWSLSRRGDFDLQAMHNVLISSAMPQIRSQITQKMFSLNPVMTRKRICIGGIADYGTYQSMINALGSMEGIDSIQIHSIQGHTICHVVDIKGSLEEIIQNLQHQQIADADIILEEEGAYIRILKH